MSEKKLSLQGNALTALLLVAITVVGMVAATGAVGAESAGIDAQELDDDVEAADEIYVDENGDAVLVYEDDEDDELNEFDLGMHVGEGLLYMLIAGEDEDLDEETAGDLSFVLEEDGFFGEGSLNTASPDEIEDMNLDISAEQTSENNNFDASMDALITSSPETADLERFETTGDVTVTGDSFSTSGDLDAQLATVMPGEFYYDVEIDETASGYTIEVTQDEIVSGFQAANWETEEAAQQTLEAQFGGIAAGFGGTEEITIDSYEYTETETGEGDLDISYTVEYENIDDGLVTALTTALAQDPELDLDQAEAQEIAESVLELEIQTIQFSAEQSDANLSADWNVDIDNYDGAINAILELADSVDEGELDDEFEEFQTTVEAQQAADLEQYYEWALSVDSTDPAVDEIEGELASDTENWAAYIEELEDRGVEGAVGDFTMDVNAGVDDDELDADMSVELEQEELVEEALDAMITAAADDPTVDSETNQFLNSLENSEFEIGQMDVNVDGQQVELEAGAKFGDLDALTTEVDDAFGGHEVTQVAGALSDDGPEAHVHVNALVDAGAGEDDIRALNVADDDTEIHTDGDWDEEFSEMDTAAAEQFLGISEDEENGEEADDADDDSLPGFGVGVALVSLLSAALFARYRN